MTSVSHLLVNAHTRPTGNQWQTSKLNPPLCWFSSLFCFLITCFFISETLLCNPQMKQTWKDNGDTRRLSSGDLRTKLSSTTNSKSTYLSLNSVMTGIRKSRPSIPLLLWVYILRVHSSFEIATFLGKHTIASHMFTQHHLVYDYMRHYLDYTLSSLPWFWCHITRFVFNVFLKTQQRPHSQFLDQGSPSSSRGNDMMMFVLRGS